MNIGYKMMTVKAFCEKYGDSNTVRDFIDFKINSITKNDALMLLKSFDIVSFGYFQDISKEQAEKLIRIIDDNDLLLTCGYRGKFKGFDVIADIILDNNIVISYEDNDANNKTLKRLLSDSFGGDHNTNVDFIKCVIGKIKNTEYVFDMLIRSITDKKVLCDYIEKMFYSMNKINDQTAIMLAPYLLNKHNYRYFIEKTINKDILNLLVIATKNKEIIAYYIYKAEKYDLICDLFKNEDIYLKYCYGVFDEGLVKSIERYLRDGGMYKFVDSNIDEYLNRSNEKIDVKFY